MDIQFQQLIGKFVTHLLEFIRISYEILRMHRQLQNQPCMLRNLRSPRQACSWVRESFSPKVIAAICIQIKDTRDTEASLASGVAKTQKHLSQYVDFQQQYICFLGCLWDRSALGPCKLPSKGPESICLEALGDLGFRFQPSTPPSCLDNGNPFDL